MEEPFPTYLKRLRAERGLTLRQVEEITGGKVSNAYLSQLENGQIQSPSVAMLHVLSAAYGVDFADMCTKACIGHEPPPAPAYCPTCGQHIHRDRRFALPKDPDR